MAVANKNLIRAINRFNILHTIRTNGMISRVDIARTTGLSQASVTGITADLIAEGLLVERKAGQSIGGRRPVLLSLNPEGAFALGVYLSIYRISVVIVNFEADILATHRVALRKSYYSPQEMAAKIERAIQTCKQRAQFADDQISGVGIGIPGLVDSRKGLIHFYPNYQWKRINLRDLVQQRIEHAAYVENSANALTLAEQWFGEASGIDNFILITLEHGVGMGIVVNGQLYRGSQGTAGEFGHLSVDPDGIPCRCGKRGCLETVVGNYGILYRAKMAARKGRWRPGHPDKISIDEVLRAAAAGDPCLTAIYARAGHVLGIGIANLITIFNPARVFISGKGTLAGSLLFDSMYAAISKNISDKLDPVASVVITPWNDINYARGAGALVLQEIYKSPANRIVPII